MRLTGWASRDVGVSFLLSSFFSLWVLVVSINQAKTTVDEDPQF